MRVEGLELQQPVVLAPVGIEELEAPGEALDDREVRLLADLLAVDHVLQAKASAIGLELLGVVDLGEALERRADHRLPLVGLLAADEFEAVVALVIGPAAVREVVVVVGDQVGIDAGLGEQRRERVVERLERAPAPVQEVEPARVQVAARRHAGHAADIVPLEAHGALGQPGKFGVRTAVPP